ncbi:MAG: TRAP transporter small permease [Thalassobaculaceae bacterium]|nr:TRAP transporter small permease [Thalassobaculaceae bacterium]
MYQTLAGFLTGLSRLLALTGGLLLLAVTVLVVLSVSGRALVWAGLAPIPGDFELVEAATALAVFCFMPWCQVRRAHVSVDAFVNFLGPRVDAVLSIVFNILMTIVAGFILWRLWAGMQDKMQYNETTFILQFPVWWGYAVCVPVAAVFVIVCAWSVVESIAAARSAYTVAETG